MAGIKAFSSTKKLPWGKYFLMRIFSYHAMIKTFNKRLINRDATVLHKNKVTKTKKLAPRKHKKNVRNSSQVIYQIPKRKPVHNCHN